MGVLKTVLKTVPKNVGSQPTATTRAKGLQAKLVYRPVAKAQAPKQRIAVKPVAKIKIAVKPAAKQKTAGNIVIRPQLGGKVAAAGLSKADEVTKEKLRSLDPSLKLWIGGLPEGVNWKQIHRHFTQLCGKPHLVDVMRRGTACVSYKTEDEVQTAIAVVNGTELAGVAIEVDAWTKPQRHEKTAGQLKSGKQLKARQQVRQVIVKTVTKTVAVPSKLSKIAEKIKGIDASLKCWVAGLAEGTSWKAVKEHFVTVGEIQAADLLRNPANAVVAFKSEEDVAAAIASLNGSELNGAIIEVDAWTKRTKKEQPEAGVKPAKAVIKMQFAKQGVAKSKLVAKAKAPAAKVAAKSSVQSKVAEKLRAIDSSFKCWIGGLADGTTSIDVKEHFQPIGEVDAADLLRKKGKAVVAFKDADNVAEAVAILNGSDLKGASIQVDFWTKPEKKSKSDA